MFASPGLRPSNDGTKAIVDSCNTGPRIFEKSDQARIDHKGRPFQGCSLLRTALQLSRHVKPRRHHSWQWSGFWEIIPSCVHDIGNYSSPMRFLVSAWAFAGNFHGHYSFAVKSCSTLPQFVTRGKSILRPERAQVTLLSRISWAHSTCQFYAKHTRK